MLAHRNSFLIMADGLAQWPNASSCCLIHLWYVYTKCSIAIDARPDKIRHNEGIMILEVLDAAGEERCHSLPPIHTAPMMSRGFRRCEKSVHSAVSWAKFDILKDRLEIIV